MDLRRATPLIKLSSLGYLEGYYYKPRVDWELLEHHANGIVALSGCLSGRVSRALSEGRGGDARADLDCLAQIFGRDSTYVEIQNAGLAEQAQVNPELIALAGETELRSRVPAAYLPTERSAMARDVLGPQTWAELTEAGVFALWLVEEAEEVTAVLVPRPEMSVVEGRLHADDHPAVRWPSGLGYWFWDGVWIPQHLAERRDALHAGDVIAERNAERRRVLASRVGWERLMLEGGGRVIQEDAYGRLWLMRHEDDEPFVAVEVVNATEEPDGTRRRYFLRVPPSTRTARRAVAWTFGLAETAYSPEVES
ncbi:MAG: DUF6745 domain-containing protein [Gaiellaceae bacterium]